MRKAGAGLFVLLLAVGVLGCTTGIKQAAYTAMGPQGRYAQIESVANLDAYGTLVVEAFESDIGPMLPAGALGILQQKVAEKMLSEGLFAAVNRRQPASATVEPGKTLVMRGRIVHYESQGARRAIGGADLLIARVALTDEDSGRSLGVVNVTGEVKSVVRDDTAEGLAKGLVSVVKENLSPAERERREGK